MKIGILGDIHANSAALSAVLDAARSDGVERLLCTGDIVGYYFRAAEVVRMLREWDVVIARGNHEDMLEAARNDPSRLPGITRKYGGGLAVALDELSAMDLDWLCALPHPARVQVDGLRVLLCHGSPWDNDRYVYPDADDATLARCAATGEDLVVMGHTHYPLHRTMGDAVLLNPGSVGQPRNRRPGAHWALLDTATRAVTLRCETYDTAAVAREARERHPELPYLADVLTRS